MKEGENMKLIKRITAYLLTFSILLSIGSSVVAAAVAPVEQEYPAHEDPSQEMLTDLEQKGVQILENNVKILVYEDRVEATGTLVLIEPIGEGIQTLPENTQIDEIGETDEYNGNND